jgi:ADP-ribosylglycohydrolase
MNDHDRAAGCLLGLAIGDAMGMPVSFYTPRQIYNRYGWVDQFYEPEKGHIYHDGLSAGMITDDTEQTLALARSFIRHKRVVPSDIVKELLAWAERVADKYASPLGPSTQKALEAIQRGIPIAEAGKTGDTNGAAMRISALGIIHGLRRSSLEELLADVILTCMPTHGTSVAIASAMAVACGISQCFNDQISLPTLMDTIIKGTELAQHYGCEVVAPSMADRLEWVAYLGNRTSDPYLVLEPLYSMLGCGVAAADSVPAAIGVFYAARGNAELTLKLAVNLGGDTDTIGAIAGALAGAYSGAAAIPAEWAMRVQHVNDLDVNDIARQLAETAPHWQNAKLPAERGPSSV